MQHRPRLNEEEYRDYLKRHGKIIEPTQILPRKIPKYLLLDIETLPASALVFGLFKQTIPHDHLLTDVVICCWSVKWLYDSEVISDVMTPEEAINKDDKRIMESLWRYLEDAEVIIGHNVRKFDIRIINSRFIYNKIKPPTPYETIDTLQASRKSLGTLSHRLDYLGKFLLRKGKLETNFSLWDKCFHGDKESLDYMLEYNKADVLLLEEVYLEIRAYIRSHPNYAIYSEAQTICCIYCGADKLSDAGIYVTLAGRFMTKRCDVCGGIMRERITDMGKEERKNLLISIAK